MFCVKNEQKKMEKGEAKKSLLQPAGGKAEN